MDQQEIHLCVGDAIRFSLDAPDTEEMEMYRIEKKKKS